MRVIKRTGEFEDVSFDKILARIKAFCSDLTSIEPHEICQMVNARIYDKVPTHEIDELTAQLCSTLSTEHPDFGTLAARIAISNHQKNTTPSFSEAMSVLYNAKDVNGNRMPLISDELWQVTQTHKDKLNSCINYDRDFFLDYFGFKTLERAYLLRVDNKVVERPQHLWMRVALGIHGNDIKDALNTYELMSTKHFTHATPVLFNAGTRTTQLASCFLVAVKDDSISGLYDTLKECALISKWAGGIGVHISNVRAKGSKIRGTNGTSTGIIKYLKVLESTALYVDQAGKRKGSFAVYLEPWHSDIEAFLELRKNHGDEAQRCRDLFTALWIPDLFMKRVAEDGLWSLMCPDECPGLPDVYGEEFDTLYKKYEQEGKYRKQIKATDLFKAIMISQIETGAPYMLYKDAANRKSNQKNLGTIKSSNLCSEIIEYSDSSNTAVCNLASICLPTYIQDGKFNFAKLHQVVQVITKNINKTIDRSMYPSEESKRSNLIHRPIGIGVQGLSDVFTTLRFSYESTEAAELNKNIFETIYHGALTASMELSKRRGELIKDGDYSVMFNITKEEVNLASKYPNWGGAYASFPGSPASEGKLQFDLWEEEDKALNRKTPDYTYIWNWSSLKDEIVKFGVRNSLLVAPMPTASTSQIMGFTESFEPPTSNIYQRRTLAGEFIVCSKYLMSDLIKLGIWSKDLKNKILLNNGSIQNIPEIPDELKALYKTVWEIKGRTIIDMSAGRGRFICQSQSLNLYMEDPDLKRLTNMHFHAWRSGLKTGMYYLHGRARSKTAAYSIEPEANQVVTSPKKENDEPVLVCRRDDPNCVMCSS